MGTSSLQFLWLFDDQNSRKMLAVVITLWTLISIFYSQRRGDIRETNLPTVFLLKYGVKNILLSFARLIFNIAVMGAFYSHL